MSVIMHLIDVTLMPHQLMKKHLRSLLYKKEMDLLNGGEYFLEIL